MIITCPACQAQYTLDPAKLGAGRTVRCVSCSHAWFQAGRDQPPPPPAPTHPPAVDRDVQAAVEGLIRDEKKFDAILSGLGAEAGDGAAGTKAAPQSRRRPINPKDAPPPTLTHNPFGIGAGAFGAGVFAALLCLTLALALLTRDAVVHRWPTMMAFYAALGIATPPAGDGLKIGDVVATRITQEGTSVLAVQAKLENISTRDAVSPSLIVSLKNQDGAVLKEWHLKTGGKTVTPDAPVPVVLKLPAPPEGGARVEIRAEK